MSKTEKQKKWTKATLLGKRGFTTPAKLKLLTWQLSLRKVLATLHRGKYLHPLVTGCRWWYSEDYKQIVGILQFYCCVIVRRCRYMTAYLSPAGAQESETTPEGSSSSPARMELWSRPLISQGSCQAMARARFRSCCLMRMCGSAAQARKGLSCSLASNKIHVASRC